MEAVALLLYVTLIFFALSGLMLVGAYTKLTRTQAILEEVEKMATKAWLMRHKR